MRLNCIHSPFSPYPLCSRGLQLSGPKLFELSISIFDSSLSCTIYIPSCWFYLLNIPCISSFLLILKTSLVWASFMLKLISLPPFLLLFSTIRNCRSHYVIPLIKIPHHLPVRYCQHKVHGLQISLWSDFAWLIRSQLS